MSQNQSAQLNLKWLSINIKGEDGDFPCLFFKIKTVCEYLAKLLVFKYWNNEKITGFCIVVFSQLKYFYNIWKCKSALSLFYSQICWIMFIHMAIQRLYTIKEQINTSLKKKQYNFKMRKNHYIKQFTEISFPDLWELISKFRSKETKKKII